MTQKLMTQTIFRGTGLVKARLEEIAGFFQQAAMSAFPDQVEEAAVTIGDAFEKGRKMLVFGNGGSASDAQHLCGELVVRFQTERRALPAIALSADSAVITACGNDFSYTDIFARQIEALGQPGDVAFGISTSGNSPNVIAAFQAARSRGLINILLTGSKNGSASEYCDLSLKAPALTTARIQELHLAAYHTICELIDSRFSR